jgi:hypothetical protein
MHDYILFLREDPAAFAGIGPAEMEAIIRRYVEWSNGVAAKGQLRGGHKLQEGTGRVLRPGRPRGYRWAL